MPHFEGGEQGRKPGKTPQLLASLQITPVIVAFARKKPYKPRAAALRTGIPNIFASAIKTLSC
jgi:hypothetical protein